MSLTPKQENFAQCIADGMTQADAYRTAYDVSADSKPETTWARASELMADSKVSGRVAELKGKLEAKALWTREMSVKALARAYKIAEQSNNSSGMTGAVKELNVMHGYNEPFKVDLMSRDGSMKPVPAINFSKLSSKAMEEILNASAPENNAE
jgi:hypothetical protein